MIEAWLACVTHPPYSPDIARSDYYLFPNLQNFLTGKKLNNDCEVKLLLVQFFVNKNQMFYENETEKCQKVNNYKRQYIMIKVFCYIKINNLVPLKNRLT